MAMSPVSRESRIYLALWRRAYLHPEVEVFLIAPNFKTAYAMRRVIYRAIKPYRDLELFDSELQLAAETYTISVEVTEDETKPCRIRWLPRASLDVLNLAALGLSEADLLLPHERKITHDLETFLGTDSAPQAPRPSNPFYTRED